MRREIAIKRTNLVESRRNVNGTTNHAVNSTLTLNRALNKTLDKRFRGKMDRRTLSDSVDFSAERVLMMNKVKGIILSFVIILLISIGSMIIVKASDNLSTEHMTRYYTSITIESEDTLWDLASEYNTGSENTTQYINNIKKMNHMTSDTLYQGESLLVYYYSSEVK